MAILMVLSSHLWASANLPPMTAKVHFLTSQGDLGVRIFFVLSGFLITYLLLNEHRKNGFIDLKGFYFRRSLRIFPVYFSYLLVLLILQLFGKYEDSISSWVGALTFTRNMLGQGRSATSHFWSLAVEEQFYLVWPITLVVAQLYQKFRVAVVILMLVVIISFISRAFECADATFVCQRILNPKSTIKYADSLAVGCLAAFLKFQFRFELRALWAHILFYAGLISLCITLRIEEIGGSQLSSSAIITAQAFLIVVCMVITVEARQLVAFKILNSVIFRRLGLISYSLYVWHMMFLGHYMGDKFDLFYGFLDWRTWWVVPTLISITSFRYLETPLVKLGRRGRPKAVLDELRPAPAGEL